MIPKIIRSVQRGVKWLKTRAEDLREVRDIAITISALIAAENNRRSHLLQRLAFTLSQRQGINGSWNDELWDTTWALQALCSAGQGTREVPVQTAISFIREAQDVYTGNWYEDLFETVLVLNLLLKIAPNFLETLLPQPLQWFVSLQREDGCILGARYTGMIASLGLSLRKAGLDISTLEPERALQYLRNQLTVVPMWTSAAWSNFYPLAALLDSGDNLSDAAVQTSVEWFLSAQGEDGSWNQVSAIHDTAMSVLVLSRLLTVPVIDISIPRTGVLNASRENGTMRVSFHGPGIGAIAPTEKIKLSDQVRTELSITQQMLAVSMGVTRERATGDQRGLKGTGGVEGEIAKIGQYAFGHLIPSRIQPLLQASTADHIRLDIDERSIDLPWELIHDGRDFLCLRYAVGRRLLSEHVFASPSLLPRRIENIRMLVIADPTGDLPAARSEGEAIATVLRSGSKIQVDTWFGSEASKKDFLLALNEYDVIHYAGHASHNSDSPDESTVYFSDGAVQAFEISHFTVKRAPAVVFLNACWSGEEAQKKTSQSPLMRGLSRTFLFAGVTAFLGYLVPIPDVAATEFAVEFYRSLIQGQTIGEAQRIARLRRRERHLQGDMTWCSSILYGDPSARVVEAAG